MNNTIEERLLKAKKELSSRRGTGRTNKMLAGAIEDALHGESGDYFLVVSHTPDWGRDMMARMSNKLHELNIPFKQRAGGALEINNGSIVLFRTEQWWDEPRNRRSISPINVYYDNVLSDLYLEKYIRFMENEVNPMPIRERSEVSVKALKHVKIQLD